MPNPIQKRISELWRAIRKAEKSGDARAALSYSRHLNDLLLAQGSSGTPIPGEDGEFHKVCLDCLDKIMKGVDEPIRPRPIHYDA